MTPRRTRELEILAERYPRQVAIKDGRMITLRPMTRDDKDLLLDFFSHVPANDRLHLADDVADPKVITRWTRELDYSKVLPILAEFEGRIIGDATLKPYSAKWMSHVAQIRVVVTPEFRQQNVARLLIRELVYHALRLGLDKIEAQLPNALSALSGMFERMGFKRETVLKNQITDLSGNLDDLIIMTQDVENFWQAIGDVYSDYAVFREF